jgi:hypothetical protein
MAWVCEFHFYPLHFSSKVIYIKLLLPAEFQPPCFPQWIQLLEKRFFTCLGDMEPVVVEWDGQYLVAGYESGEELILDFNYIFPQ